MLKKLHIHTLIGIMLILSTFSCNEETLQKTVTTGNDGGPAVADATIGDVVEVSTRGLDPYDLWSTSSFSTGDAVGIYARGGLQNPEDPDDYSLPIENGKMFYEGAVGTASRFSNGDLILRASTVHDNYSIMYYPYYDGMPSAEDKTSLLGMPLRILDKDGIEKGVDFMQTTYSYSTTGYYSPVNYLSFSGGVLQPRFYHYMSELVIQRGSGFEDAKDKRVWVIMKDPWTDMRIKRSSSYSYEFQKMLDEGESVVLLEDYPKATPINKYRVWECWEGNPYNNKLSYYVIIPPKEVSYILIQDNDGEWQNVFDFYLYETGSTTNKTPKSNNRYIITVSMQGLKPVVRPVCILDWVTGGEITDQRDEGINSWDEYADWVATYNSYIYGDRMDAQLEETLRKYGEAEKDLSTGRMSWTFYINHDLYFPPNATEYIDKLDDVIMGASVYTNYVISNTGKPWIGEMTENGGIKALDFQKQYIVDVGGVNEYSGAIVREMKGGFIDYCHMMNAVIVSDKKVGMVAGGFIGGKITNSSFSGEVIGVGTSESYPGLLGTDPSEAIDLTGTEYSDLYYESYN